MGEEFEGSGAGFRWLTVGPKDQPDLQMIAKAYAGWPGSSRPAPR